MNRPERSDYVQANKRKLEIMKETTTQIIDMMNPYVATKEGDEGDLTVVQGEPTAEHLALMLQQRGVEASSDTVDVAVAQESLVLRRRAEVAILGLQLSTSLLYLNSQDLPLEDTLSASPLFPYEHALYASIDALSAQGDTVRLSRVQMHPEGINDVTELHEIAINDGELVQSLAIASLNAVCRNVKYSVRATQDELVQRCVQLLGQDQAMRIMPILSRSTDTHEIDAVLSGIWREHQRSGVRGEAAPLLNDLRARAIAAQDAREMTQLYNTDLPSVDKLNEFGYLLGIK